MPDFEDILQLIPKSTKDILIPIWDRLPEDEKEALKEKFEGLPLDFNLMNMLLDLTMIQMKIAVGRKSKVAIVGPANVGKSTLYNQLIREKSDKAEVSPVPGTTRINQLADAGVFHIIDTPGADAVGYVGDQEKEEALSAAQEADFLIIMFDAIQGIKDSELSLYHQLVALKKTAFSTVEQNRPCRHKA